MNSVRINQNISAMNAWRNLQSTDGAMSKSLERLSSGLRINRAADDAAGLAISEKMRGQVKGLNQARTNAQDAISLIQTAEGGLNETHSILQRMRELAVQSASDTATNADRQQIQKEVDQLAQEISRISNTSEFNTKNLLAGGFANQYFQIGANQDQNVALSVGAMDAFSLGVTSDITNMTGFAAGTTTLTGVSEKGSGLAIGNAYTINVDAVAAGAVGSKISGSGAAITMSNQTSYSGSSDKTYRIEVTAVNTGAVTGIRYSTDAGTSWTAAGVVGNAVTIDGFTATFGGAGNAVNDVQQVAATAAYADVKLQGPGGTPDIGSAVRVHNNQSSVTIGDAATDRIATTSFNFATLADGDATFNITAGAKSAKAVIGAAGAVSTGATVAKGVLVTTQSAANLAITKINSALEQVSGERSKLGALQNRLEHTINNLGTAAENIGAAESRIRDVDMASEMASFTRSQILLQAGTAMMAQANQKPQTILQLLR
jgi:flagellin